MVARHPEIVGIVDPVDEDILRPLVGETLREMSVKHETSRGFPAIDTKPAHVELFGDKEIAGVEVIHVRQETDIGRMMLIQEEKLLLCGYCERVCLPHVFAIEWPHITIPGDRTL